VKSPATAAAASKANVKALITIRSGMGKVIAGSL
jgi:hypothetical protein